MTDPKEAAKRLVGYAAVDRYVKSGMCVGLGTGTTAYWAIKRTGERVAAGEKLEAIVDLGRHRKALRGSSGCRSYPS